MIVERTILMESDGGRKSAKGIMGPNVFNFHDVESPTRDPTRDHSTVTTTALAASWRLALTR